MNHQTMQIGCLHTAHSNINVFEAALRSLGRADIKLNHMVRPDLLAAAVQAGGINEEITMQTHNALGELCEKNDAVLLTCSTLGPALQSLVSTIPILRVDEALARQAVQMAGRVIVLCAVETTLKPTSELFRMAARDTGAAIEVRLINGAWDYFMRGEVDRYNLMLADAADRAYADGARAVAFAQASMAGAAAHVKQNQRPLTSPACGLLAAIATSQHKEN